MKQNTSKLGKERRAARRGQAVAAMVMALAVAVGGVGTTALLAAQPVGLTVEPSTIQWEDDSTPDQHQSEPEKTGAEKAHGQGGERSGNGAARRVQSREHGSFCGRKS